MVEYLGIVVVCKRLEQLETTDTIGTIGTIGNKHKSNNIFNQKCHTRWFWMNVWKPASTRNSSNFFVGLKLASNTEFYDNGISYH